MFVILTLANLTFTEL